MTMNDESRTSVKDGGPAFARPAAEHGHGGHYEQDGMTLRDYFAGQALAGLVAYPGRQGETHEPLHFAQWAYAVSDAMIQARGH